MNLEEKVNILEERIKKLEKIEKRRKTLKWIKISIKMVLIIIICIFVYKGYIYFKDNYVETFDNLRKEVNEKLDFLKDYDIFRDLGLKK